jgi:hypothetical protein
MMSDSFFRRNSADQEKKLDADQVNLQGLEVYRQRVAFAPGELKVDEVSTSLTYVGEAEAGVLPSSPLWRIRKIQKVGSVTSISYALGDSGYTHVWDDRAIYTY